MMQKRTLLIWAFLIFLIVFTQCTDGRMVSESNPRKDFNVMREKMLETQIKARGVKDPRVLSALLKVERQRFDDATIVTAAPDHILKPLIEQLKGGSRMAVPVGAYAQELKKIVKCPGKIKTTDVIPVVFVPMAGEGIKQRNDFLKKGVNISSSFS